jgi:hypothetical protein
MQFCSLGSGPGSGIMMRILADPDPDLQHCCLQYSHYLYLVYSVLTICTWFIVFSLFVLVYSVLTIFTWFTVFSLVVPGLQCSHYLYLLYSILTICTWFTVFSWWWLCCILYRNWWWSRSCSSQCSTRCCLWWWHPQLDRHIMKRSKCWLF